jgi:hypothetical protein
MIKFILIIIIIIIILKLYYNSTEHFKSSLFYDKREPQPNPNLIKHNNIEYSSIQNNRIFTNSINTTNNIKRDDQYNKPNKLITESLIKEIISEDNISEELNRPDNGLDYSTKGAYMSPKNKIDYNPKNKYKKYEDALWHFEPAGKVINKDVLTIDQSIGSNITNFINNGIVSNEDIDNIDTKSKTIKEIYDAITNDNRLELQKNLDDLDANSGKKETYNIKEKYGATRFDTYSLS